MQTREISLSPPIPASVHWFCPESQSSVPQIVKGKRTNFELSLFIQQSSKHNAWSST